MRLAALQSLISTELADILVIRSRLGLAVSSRPARFLLDAGPRSLTSSGSSSHALDLLFRVHDHSRPGWCSFEPQPPSLGFLSPSRHQCKEFTSQRASHAHLCSALSVSHALDGFSLSAPCGLVSSHYHVQDFLFRGFPRCPTESPHRRPVPSWRWRPSPPIELPRLSSSSHLLFRVLIQTTIRPVKQGV